MLMCKILSHIKVIKNILLGHKIIHVIMNDMGMNHSLHIGIYAACIKFHAISTFLKKTTEEKIS